MGSDNRKRHVPPIMVRVTPEEKARIHAQAEACALSAPAYLRNLGLGHDVAGVMDQKAILDLLSVNADLGRLGGLLKLWLTHDERLEAFSVEEVRGLLAKIETTQRCIREKVEAL